jgi:hypothetical protein
MKSTLVAALAAGIFTSSEALNLVKRETPRVVGIPIHRRDTSVIVASPSLRKRASKAIQETLDNFEVGATKCQVAIADAYTVGWIFILCKRHTGNAITILSLSRRHWQQRFMDQLSKFETMLPAKQ